MQDVKNAMRDHYEGTPLDISKDFGAGPYHTPYRLSPLSFKVGDREYFNERPISTQQSGFVFVAQMRSELPDPIGGVLWFGTDDANMTVFTPVYCCTDKVPVCYPRGWRRLHHFLLELRFLDFQLGGQYGISPL